MGNLALDLRFALRAMLRGKAFTVATLATLALGIGANTAVFCVVYGVLLRPLPYAEPDRLVRLWEEHPGAVAAMGGHVLSNLTYHAWAEAPRTLDGMAAYSTRRFTITGFDEPLRAEGAAVSPALFDVLRARPSAGRFFRPEEEAAGSDQVAVLSHGFWRERFGADAAAVGRTLVIDGRAHTIVGVAAPELYFPDREARLWTPLAVRRRAGPSDGTVSRLRVIARLGPGATAAQAAAEGTAAARGLGARPVAADLIFGKGGPVTVHTRSLAEETTADVKPALLVLFAAVGLVLLIACANVANLFLSRGVARARELAVRAALGAGRARLVQQLLTESLTLALCGGLLGLVLGWALTAALPAFAPRGFPRLDDVRIDGRVLAFAALVALVSGLAAGLAPALRGARFDLAAALHGGARTTAGGFRGAWASRMRGGLLVAEAGLAVMLLIGAGLLIHSFARLLHVDAGFDAANVLTARVFLPAGAPAERSLQFVDDVLARLRRAPGVVAAGAGNMAPLTDILYVSGFRFPARDGGEPVMARALQNVITPGYAEALGFRVRAGRLFTDEDARASTQTMLVNEAFVRQYWPAGREITGAQFQGLLSEASVTTTIAGVVADVFRAGPDKKPQPEVYVVARPGRALGHISLILRASSDPAAGAPLLRSIVREVEPNAAIEELGILASRVSASVSQPRFVAAVLASFAAVALALAAVGLYGVLAYNVSQRRRELGVRAALGATRGDLVRLVVRQGLAVTVAGLALGVAGAAALARLMSKLLFGVAPLDAVAFIGAPAVLLVVALAACLLPARRAAAADPAEALRCE